jgi:hypothetical protein
MVCDPDEGPTGETDDGIPTPFLTAVDGLEQVGEGAVGELEIDAERCVEIGEDLAHQGNAVIALFRQGIELIGGHGALRNSDDTGVDQVTR